MHGERAWHAVPECILNVIHGWSGLQETPRKLVVRGRSLKWSTVDTLLVPAERAELLGTFFHRRRRSSFCAMIKTHWDVKLWATEAFSNSREQDRSLNWNGSVKKRFSSNYEWLLIFWMSVGVVKIGRGRDSSTSLILVRASKDIVAVSFQIVSFNGEA